MRLKMCAQSFARAGVSAAQKFFSKTKAKICSSAGQGTTEYAILVGVLVVIAILAIVLFKPKVQELWDAIVSGMNSL